MKCFYDPTQDAVGTCKSCQKGLSHDHLVDLGQGLACKGRCEEDVRSLNALIERNKIASVASNQILRRGSATGYASGIFMALCGLVFILTALKVGDFGFSLYFGGIFVIYGLWSMYRVSRYARIVSTLPDSESDAPSM